MLLAVKEPVTAAGLALSVIGLVPLCATRLQLIENSINASKDAAKAFDSISFQSGVCKSLPINEKAKWMHL